MPRYADVPAALRESPINAWHVLTLFAIAYGTWAVFSPFVAIRVGLSATQMDRELVHGSIWCFIMAGLVAVLRPLRGAVPELLRTPASPFRMSDIAIAALLCTTFMMGAYRILVVMPMVHSDAAYYEFWKLGEAYARASWKDHLVLILVTCLLAPLHEEFVFRGILLNVIRTGRSLAIAIAVTSVLFGFMHGRHAIPTGFAGLVFAIVYLRFGSLWPAIFAHALANVLALPYLLGSLVIIKTREQAATYSGWFFEFLLAALFIPVAMAFWRRFRPE